MIERAAHDAAAALGSTVVRIDPTTAQLTRTPADARFSPDRRAGKPADLTRPNARLIGHVARVTLGSGTVMAVKLEAPGQDGQIDRERSVLGMLHRRGAPVPLVLACGTVGAFTENEARSSGPGPHGPYALEHPHFAPHSPSGGQGCPPTTTLLPGAAGSPPGAPCLPGADLSVEAPRLLAAEETLGRESGSVTRGLDGGGEKQPLRGSTGEGVTTAWLATSWAGDVTLDAALQRADEREARTLGLRLVTALGMVEAALLGSTRDTILTPNAEAVALSRALRAPWVEALPNAFAWLDVAPAAIRRATAWVREAIDVRSEPLTLGLLDYHAGNVIVPDIGSNPTSSDPLIVVDVGTIGWDWPGRRVAQCALATGVSSANPHADDGAQGGTFRSALDREVINAAGRAMAMVHGGNANDWSDAVIAHALVLLATAAVHVRAVREGVAHPARAQSWADVSGRRAALHEVVTSVLSLT